MELRGIFKCQECGATGTKLIQAEDKRMICADRDTCTFMRSREESEHWAAIGHNLKPNSGMSGGMVCDWCGKHNPIPGSECGGKPKG